MDTKERIIALFANSTVTQGTLSVIVVGGWMYMMITGVPVPDALDIVVGTVIGTFFGMKVQAAIDKNYQRSLGKRPE